MVDRGRETISVRLCVHRTGRHIDRRALLAFLRFDVDKVDKSKDKERVVLTTDSMTRNVHCVMWFILQNSALNLACAIRRAHIRSLIRLRGLSS
ncbi:hypothetical protein KIN20_033161 [Parelaphostrongylus tenuis]|uniref:Uncharacterized protein n=1 Tax=Parelaphostrongylus tenuis TaxID=148309 RepID=A0AAD5R7R7_PARTN|nr:hypothetical protein KIN20_033161 [Parelaphostrongylus tenuis]